MRTYLKQLLETIGKIAQLSPDTVKGYQTLSAAGTKTNHLDEKTRQLISLAVAVTTLGAYTAYAVAASKCDGSTDCA